MATKITSLHSIASEAPRDQVRDLVLPVETGNKGCLGVVLHSHPPWLIDISTAVRLDVPFAKPAVAMAFRPVSATEVNGERNHEVAIAYGANSAKVEFYDVALGVFLEPLYFPRVQSLAYNFQGDKLALGTGSGRVCLFALDGDKRRKELFSTEESRQAIVRLVFTGQGESLFALTAGGAVYRIDLSSGKAAQAEFLGRDEEADFDCWAHALHSSARLAALAGSVNRGSGCCKVWLFSLDDGKCVSIETGHKVYVRRLQFIGDEQLIVIGDQGAELYEVAERTRCRVKKCGTALQVVYSAVQFGDRAYVVGTPADTGAGAG